MAVMGFPGPTSSDVLSSVSVSSWASNMLCSPASWVRGERDNDWDSEDEFASEEGSDRGSWLLGYELDAIMEGGVDVDMIFSIESESGSVSESQSASNGAVRKSSGSSVSGEIRAAETPSPISTTVESESANKACIPSISSSMSNSGGTPSAPLTLSQINSDRSWMQART